MSKQMDYEIRNAEIEKLLKQLGKKINATMPAGFGFTLLIFGYNDNSLFYLSSAERQGIINSMREFIQKYGEN